MIDDIVDVGEALPTVQVQRQRAKLYVTWVVLEGGIAEMRAAVCLAVDMAGMYRSSVGRLMR